MVYKTCVSIGEKTPKKIRRNLSKALKKSEYVEIRFDFLNPKSVPETLDIIKKDLRKCICTLRPSSEGGKFSGTEKNRISIIKLIAEYNPFLLDIEFNTIKKIKIYYVISKVQIRIYLYHGIILNKLQIYLY